MPAGLLLVDDQHDFVQILGERLEAKGFSLRLACSGEEGLRALGEIVPDAPSCSVSNCPVSMAWTSCGGSGAITLRWPL